MRLIDADKLKEVPMFNGKYDKENANENFIYGIETVIDFINELPTIESSVVRCKDCVYVTKTQSGLLKCNGIFRSANWFCADGVKRE